MTLVDDWRGFGQRTTASGSARYDRARADRGDVFPAAERFSYQAHFYQIAMLSVLTGITRGALRDGSAALKERKRNYPQGLTEVPSDDAQLLAVIGQVSAEAFAAEAALTHSARSLDRIVAGRIAGDDEKARQRLIDAEVAVTQAQLVIIAAALQATTTILTPLAHQVFPKSGRWTATGATRALWRRTTRGLQGAHPWRLADQRQGACRRPGLARTWRPGKLVPLV